MFERIKTLYWKMRADRAERQLAKLLGHGDHELGMSMLNIAVAETAYGKEEDE